MKKCFTLFFITALLSVFCACESRPSKAFRSMQQEMTDIEKSINETEDCDDLQMLSFSILGLRSDLANLRNDEAALKDTEAKQLEDMIDLTEKLFSARIEALGCTHADAETEELDTSGEEDAYSNGQF